ncbi:MAG: SET domain-containing protein-lysine N-methyltransferase [Myxococcales bacterium]|nr:SET domain-containing protein-lysine N-methyltransferase [Myxococcales bacterium]
MRGLIDCSKVFVDEAPGKGAGAYAACDIAEGEIVEKGIVRRLPTGFDGHASPYVFTWSADRTTWAIGSGASTFYNCSTEPNTEMDRDFAHDTFVIRALRDIAEGEELTHTYKSLAWRGCFEDLRDDG